MCDLADLYVYLNYLINLIYLVHPSSLIVFLCVVYFMHFPYCINITHLILITGCVLPVFVWIHRMIVCYHILCLVHLVQSSISYWSCEISHVIPSTIICPSVFSWKYTTSYFTNVLFYLSASLSTHPFSSQISYMI
jgi:hypothetical protein